MDEPTPLATAEAKEYGRRKLYCTLGDLLLDVAYLTVFAMLFAVMVDEWLLELDWLENRWLRLAAYFVVLTGGHALASLPLAYYSGFVLEHHYQLSRQSFARWFGRYALQGLLVCLLGLALVEGLFAVIRFTGPWWWLAAAGGSFAVSIALGQLAPIVILPLFYKVERLEDEELRRRFDHLASGTGLHIAGIYRLRLSRDTVKANAMLAGLGRTRRVILGDTLIDGFTYDEIEVVMAHEVGHHVHRHIVKFLILGLVYSLLVFWIGDHVLRAYVARISTAIDYRDLPVYCLPLLMLTMSLASILLSPLSNGLSRYFEWQADRYALLKTRHVKAFRSAFQKLATMNKADPDPHPVEVIVFHDHPTIAQRIAFADNEGRKMEAGNPEPFVP
jgi:STE24 endopeptidase